MAVPINLTLAMLLIFGSYMIIQKVRSLCCGGSRGEADNQNEEDTEKLSDPGEAKEE